MADEHEHERLAVFVGDWAAEGTAYGADLEGAPWRSIHTARWHSGPQFVVQDERANGPFDTMSFLGWDQERASITFSDDGRTQTHHWEFRPEGEWIALCDRVARRVD